MADFLERIAEAEARSRDLETQLSDPEIGKEPGAIEKLGKRLGALRPLLEVGGKYKAAVSELAERSDARPGQFAISNNRRSIVYSRIDRSSNDLYWRDL